MGTERTLRGVRAGVTASALWLAVFGATLLVAPEEMSRVLEPVSGGHALVQLLGAALLGCGAMNWIARGSALGGIYGRAVVAGNQSHLTIGALVLVKRGVDVGDPHPAFWVITGLYILGAAFFGYLTFFSSGLREHSTRRLTDEP